MRSLRLKAYNFREYKEGSVTIFDLLDIKERLEVTINEFSTLDLTEGLKRRLVQLKKDLEETRKMIRRYNGYRTIKYSTNITVDYTQLIITFPQNCTMKFKEALLKRNGFPTKDLKQPNQFIHTIRVDHCKNVCTITRYYDV